MEVLTWADGAALVAVLAWGVNFPILKLMMTTVAPLPLMFLRVALSSAILILVLRLFGRWRLPERRDLRLLVTAGLVGIPVNQLLYMYGLQLTTASHSGLIFTLTPLFVYGLSHLLGQLTLRRQDVLGLALGLAGALLIIGAPSLTGSGGDGATLLGDLLTVGAALWWGVWTMLSAPLLRRHGTLLATTWITIAGGLGLFPLALPGLVAQDWRQVSWAAVPGLVYASSVAGALGGLLWYAAVRRLGPARTMVYANMESLFAVLAAALVLGERVEWTALVGGAGVVGGVLLTRRAGGAYCGAN